jgi:PAS domain S-box-containing protein
VISDVSEQTLKLHGFCAPRELIGRKFFELVAPEERGKAMSNFLKTLRQGVLKNVEYTLIKKDGTRFTGEINSTVIKDARNRPKHFIAITRDITERKIIEDELKASLREKEVLLREVHHRVKNNLQVISGLLDLKSLQINSEEVRQMCQDARAEIHTLALIHEHLYQSRQFTHIEMGEYVRDLVKFLYQVYADKVRLITPILDYQKIYLTINQALPLAIIINEAISNVFKHAFREGQEGTLEITLKKVPPNNVFLKIKDNGVGLPPNLDIQSSRTLGIRLMKNLVEDQLKGKFYLTQDKGTSILIQFSTI